MSSSVFTNSAGTASVTIKEFALDAIEINPKSTCKAHIQQLGEISFGNLATILSNSPSTGFTAVAHEQDVRFAMQSFI